MHQKSRNEAYAGVNNNNQAQHRAHSISLITNDEFYGNNPKNQLGENSLDTQQLSKEVYNKNTPQVRKSYDLRFKNMKILQELKDISDQLHTALEKQKTVSKQHTPYHQKDQRVFEQQDEIEKAFSILELQKRDIDLLTTKLNNIVHSDKRVEELNQQLFDKNKEIKELEHEKNYLNKVLGNVDKIMKAEGQKDQRLQQVHSAYKEEVRLLKERIRDLETTQRQSEKNAMKLHQHYLDIEDKYKQQLQNNSAQNKSPNRMRGSQLDNLSNQYLESLKSDYEDKLQTLIQKQKDKENENKSLTQQLQNKKNEVDDLKIQLKEYQIQIQREKRDKEMIESYNKNLRDQLKLQAQKLSQDTIPTVGQLQGKEIIKVPVKSGMNTPRKDAQSPYKSVNTSIRRDSKSNSNSQERNKNSLNKGNQNGLNDGVKIYKRQESPMTKRRQNLYNNHTMSMDIQHSRENIEIEDQDKMHSSVFQDKFSTPSTPQRKYITKKSQRNSTVNNSSHSSNSNHNNYPNTNNNSGNSNDNNIMIYKSSDKKDTILSNNNSNIFSTNHTSNGNNRTGKKQSNLFMSKLSTKGENEDLLNQLHPLSARNRVKDNVKGEKYNSNNSQIENSSPMVGKRSNDQSNLIIETPYVRTLNTRYLALKNNQNDSKNNTLQTELSTLLEKKQKKSQEYNKSPVIKTNTKNIDNDSNKLTNNNTNVSQQYPSDASEQDLNHTFTQFQKEVSQIGVQQLMQQEEDYESNPKRNTLYPPKEKDMEGDHKKQNGESSNKIVSQTPNVNQNRAKWEAVKIKQLSIGKVQPHNQIAFSDKEFIMSSNPNDLLTTKKIVGGRFWIFKPTNKIMGLQMLYLTNSNKTMWGPANVHIFTSNVTIQSFNLASHFKEGDDSTNLDFITTIGCKYNYEYSYVENMVFVSNNGIVYSFGKSNSDPKSLLTYFDIEMNKEAPFSIFGAISKEYDPMSGHLVGTKLSYFGCHVINFDSKTNSKESTPVNSANNLQPVQSKNNLDNHSPTKENKQTNQHNNNQQEQIDKNKPENKPHSKDTHKKEDMTEHKKQSSDQVQQLQQNTNQQYNQPQQFEVQPKEQQQINNTGQQQIQNQVSSQAKQIEQYPQTQKIPQLDGVQSNQPLGKQVQVEPNKTNNTTNQQQNNNNNTNQNQHQQQQQQQQLNSLQVPNNNQINQQQQSPLSQLDNNNNSNNNKAHDPKQDIKK